MKIIKIDEDSPRNGYCALHCEFSQEEINIFVEYAVNDILKKQIKKMEKDNKRRCFNCDEEIDDDTLYKYPNTELCSECIADFPEDTP